MKGYDNKFKESSPENTYFYLKDILDREGWLLEEEWQPITELSTYSLRVTLKGAKAIGSNGKGTNEAYARASAYAEFFERLQNMKLSPVTPLLLAKQDESDFFIYEDEVILTSDELLEEDNAFLRTIFEKCGVSGATLEVKRDLLSQLQINDYIVLNKPDSYTCVPFYSVKEGKIVHLPYMLYSSVYGSNGMCAGNTKEEALVQGFSEIYERNANNRIMQDKISIPEIPVEVIQQYPEIYAMYSAIADHPDYKVVMKDASMGMNIPIVCLIVINLNESTCGVKFGVHPDLRIAMERTFTEAVQGSNLERFSSKSRISFHNELVDETFNRVNSYRTSDAMYPYQLLSEKSIYRWNNTTMEGNSNEDFLKAIIDDVLSRGYDILIHDCSYLNFPSYHIIVPDLSDVESISKENLLRFPKRFSCQKLLMNPGLINDGNAKDLIENLGSARNNVLENSLYQYSGVYSTYPYLGNESYIDLPLFAALISYQISDFTTLSRILSGINNLFIQYSLPVTDQVKIILKYLEGMCILKSHPETMNYISKMFSQDLVSFIDENFQVRDQVIEKLYPELEFDGKYCQELSNYKDLIKRFKEIQQQNPVTTSCAWIQHLK